MPTARYGLSTSVVNGKIYAIGGRSGVQFFSTVAEYDPTTDTWTRKASMPTAREMLSTSEVDGKIYAIGGCNSSGPLATVEEYDPATDTWRKRADMPDQEWGLSTSVVDDKIYTMGGSRVAVPVWEYDPATNRWTAKTNMTRIRSGLSTSVLDGKIYAIGGGEWDSINTVMIRFSTVEAYDPATDTWTPKADMPTARYRLSTSVVNGKIYAIGGAIHTGGIGRGEIPLSTVEEYDPATDAWAEMPDIQVARSHLSTCTLNRKIYAIGGRSGAWPAVTGAVEEFDPTPFLSNKAYAPDPPDGAENVVSPLLRWAPGRTAALHDIYLGTDKIAVTSATSSDPMGWAEVYKVRHRQAMWWEPTPWIPETTYYWRIDEMEADGTTIHYGDVWSFTAAPASAYNPDPPDGAKNMPTDKQLSWTAGATAVTHDVYFGTDETEVINGTGGTFRANQQNAVYAPGTLAKGTTYYWRIDEVEQNLTTKHTGDVWSFATVPEFAITDPSLLGWWKLDEGQGNLALDSSGHDHHGDVRGGTTWIGGFHGGALEFGGWPGSYVDLGNWNPSDGDLTVALWVKWNGLSDQWQGLIGKRDSWAADDMMWQMEAHRDSGTLSVLCEGIGGLQTGEVLLVREWQHWAFTSDTSAAIVYRDGVELLRGPFSYGSDPGSALVFGACERNGGNPFNGALDDVRIYNRILTQDEIKKVMRGNLLLAWNANPANGSISDVDAASFLCWSPGDDVAKHDVYFGTDADAVEDADTTTAGIYRGRIDPNSYTPPEGVQFGQTYYWRIDEYNNDATISEGRIWSFTVADYLIIDDFEAYDDLCNRVFYTWEEGGGYNPYVECGILLPYLGNGTGSIGGYAVAPYAEQTIVHEGDQSMPMEYLNDGSTGKALYSETERTFDTPQDWTRHGVKVLTLWFRGLPASVGSFNYDPGTGIYTMTADGQDILKTQQPPGSGNWVEHDEFHYAYKQLSSNGSIEAVVLSVENTHSWAKAGVMIRETLEANSIYAMMTITPGQRVAFQHRATAVDDSDGTTLHDLQAPRWVRLTRSGDNFTGEHSADGATWETVGTHNIPMAADVYIGLALTSHNNDPTVACTATFSDVTTTGPVTGQWQSQDIGIASNDAERLYVALEDSTGTVQDVAHPDPNAVQLHTWQEWNIDLADFTPVDLTKVKKMYIGVGDRNAPELGGGGMLYVDDIRLYQPRCVPSLLKPDADFDDNCRVDYLDLEIMASEWLVDANDLQADLDLDNDVDFKDYAGLADTWLDELLWP